ncbi:hypothetical protein WA1_38900 [Scytonema hofmannii PCC 7110]|uniref:Uncharacterized protein n=1 Tax=Scytonema hofmannii PCC 7110 TaxID=128403 RepID=A0A139X0Y8_9CYAN|nr:DUF6717 family protein [Scytonema hofmannii]KYC38303.1 hypothetical protein WA1_38900 [Scytonema hofmannii PCC 7110]
MSNFLMAIFPYRYEDTWVFDDKAVGLEREPFVCGVSQMIDNLVENIPNADMGFKLIFSQNPFPGYQAELIHSREEYGGHWYCWQEKEKEGWLCPALFRYFDLVPNKIYCKAEKFSWK